MTVVPFAIGGNGSTIACLTHGAAYKHGCTARLPLPHAAVRPRQPTGWGSQMQGTHRKAVATSTNRTRACREFLGFVANGVAVRPLQHPWLLWKSRLFKSGPL